MSDEKMTAIERLEALLDEKDNELRELQAAAEKREYGERWGWMRQRKSEETEGLPVPRLEIRWRKLDPDGYAWASEYNLVYRHFLGDVLVQPFSVTKCSGGSTKTRVQHDGKVETPFRDGAHIAHDMRHLNLPGYAIAEGVVTKLEAMTRANPYDETSQRRGVDR